jgi:hypothetical protein
MINTKLKQVLTFLSKRKKEGPVYTPQFISGDLIINKYLRNGQMMDLICKVVGIIRDENDLECKYAHYKLQTVFNNGVKQKLYDRTQHIQTIDKYYRLIKPETAQILYGIEVSKPIEIKKPTVKGE